MKRDLDSLLETIRYKYAMYIGEPSITNLSLFICGYSFAVYDREGTMGFIDKLATLTKWLTKSHDIHESLGWADILLGIAGNEELAFNLFWQKWDEFCSLRNCPEITFISDTFNEA